MTQTEISSKDIDALRRFDSCTLANAIERLNVRPRNEGFMPDGPDCMFRGLPPVAGYAVTGRMRAASQPVNGQCYYDRMDWWRYITSVPPPRVVVVLDADDPPGVGALFGELHAHLCRALECVAYITNGAVRDLPEIERLGFQLFARKLSPSHAYAHIVDFGEPVEIGGLRIRSGDLLHADLHGVQTVPLEIATRLPAIASEVLTNEQALIRMCLDGNFSIERLAAHVREFTEAQTC
jgi:4-hydroxy-4-methyl-2-oxoglutarate aldolase